MTKRILIIEDDKAIARLLRDNLEYEGFLVETCENGRHALATVKRFTPDLLLLDIMLPHGVDGFEICRSLKYPSSSCRRAARRRIESAA
jgi:DNA-binding response OmpR family regulator